jgi:hypothetical protein
VAHACNPSYVGGWDWEDHGSKPAWAISSYARFGGSQFQSSLDKKILWDPTSKEKAGHGDMRLSSQLLWEAENGRVGHV